MLSALLCAFAATLFAPDSFAQDEPSKSPTAPPSASTSASTSATTTTTSNATSTQANERAKIRHAGVLNAKRDEALLLRASIERPELVRRLIVVYTVSGDDSPHEIPFERAANGPYAAMIPAKDLKAPGIAYMIELESLDGTRSPAFYSRERLHFVHVLDDETDQRERALLKRLHGRRSEITTTAELVRFGQTSATVQDRSVEPINGTYPTVQKKISDQYYRIEASYTYRVLRDVAEFGIRAGVVRGESVVPNETDSSKYKVGLNYGAPTLRIRATDWFHIEGTFLTSVTEVGFSVGGGAAVMLGDPYGQKLTVGFESIQIFGTRGYSRLDLPLTDRVAVAPIIEISDMPHASQAGVRLLTEVGLDLGGGFRGAVRGGYQARNFNSGGPSLGGTIAYAF
ncbi:MAG: hypothetical protein U0165_06130 [Polyangiaceae bacterium]